jgi:hypothetical protein
MMNRRSASAGVGLLVLAAALVAWMLPAAGAAPSTSTQPKAPAATPGTNCFKSFNSGAGDKFMGWCYTADANLIRFESPAGFEHIRNGTFLEGYAICTSGGVEAYDAAASGEAGFNAPTQQPAANTVRRATSSGRFLLTTVFSQNTTEKFAKVTMSVKNTTGATIAGVRLSRFVDFDIDNDSSNDRFDQTTHSLIAVKIHGMALSGTSFGTGRVVQIEAFGDLSDDAGCDATTPLAPPVTGDNAGRVTYNLGNMTAGQTKTVVFRYQRL